MENSLDFSFYEYLWWREKNCQQPWYQNHHPKVKVFWRKEDCKLFLYGLKIVFSPNFDTYSNLKWQPTFFFYNWVKSDGEQLRWRLTRHLYLILTHTKRNLWFLFLFLLDANRYLARFLNFPVFIVERGLLMLKYLGNFDCIEYAMCCNL